MMIITNKKKKKKEKTIGSDEGGLAQLNLSLESNGWQPDVGTDGSVSTPTLLKLWSKNSKLTVVANMSPH